MTTTGGTGWYVASTIVSGIGYGVSFAVVADTAVGAVPAERAGAAGALAETGNEIGNALGIALFGSLAALVFRVAGPDLAAPTLGETLPRPQRAPEAEDDAKSAFVTGLRIVAATAAFLHLALGVGSAKWTARASAAAPWRSGRRRPAP